jgi:hypothetical protein
MGFRIYNTKKVQTDNNDLEVIIQNKIIDLTIKMDKALHLAI